VGLKKEESAKVSVGLIVMRPSGAQIALSEWTKIVDLDSDLRMRVEPYEAINPETGERIRIKAGEADAELRVGDHCVRSCVIAGANSRPATLMNSRMHRTRSA
jgi:hypothetical protein